MPISDSSEAMTLNLNDPTDIAFDAPYPALVYTSMHPQSISDHVYQAQIMAVTQRVL